MEYSAQKAAEILKQTHLKPLSEIFTQEQLLTKLVKIILDKWQHS